MVELLLNVLWLLVALAAIGYCWGHWPGAESEAQLHNDRFRKWVALACGLILLFFVISLTDDLHPELIALEDSSRSKRVLVGWANLHGAGNSAKAVANHPSAILPDLPSLASARAFIRVMPAEVFPHAWVSLRPTPGRAPPFLSL